MTRLLNSELLKLRTTRTFYALIGSAVTLIVIIAVLGAALGKSRTRQRRVVTCWHRWAGAAVRPVIGVIGVTTEIRHGTITPSLLVEPVRPG